MKKILLGVCIIVACNNNTDKRGKEISITTNDSLISTILGKWGEVGNPVWKIDKDSIYYFNENKSYYYLVHDGDMIVLYKSGPYSLNKIHSLNDTLFFKINDVGGFIKAFRVK